MAKGEVTQADLIAALREFYAGRTPYFLVVDDHDIVRKSIVEILEGICIDSIVGEAKDGNIALDKVKALLSDGIIPTVLCDTSMSNCDGPEFYKNLVAYLSQKDGDYRIPFLAMSLGGEKNSAKTHVWKKVGINHLYSKENLGNEAYLRNALMTSLREAKK